MNYPYYNHRQSYPQTPVPNSYDQRRSSSSASQPHAHPFHNADFQPQLQFPLANQYGFDQPNEWTEHGGELIDLSAVDANNFTNLTDIHEYTRPVQEPPWAPTGRPKGRGIDESGPFTPPSASHVPKAKTVAGPLPSPDTFKRPSLGPQPSYISIPDSGYGSQPALADGITSSTQAKLKDDDSAAVGTQLSLATVPPPPSSVKTDPSPGGIKRRRSKSFEESCPHCGKQAKNRSDAVKHQLQHQKPYRCDICTRTDGFATQNDLERHRKSVHGASPRVGKTTRYVCQACKPSPGSKRKLWPRLDNFKAHVRRKHVHVDVDHFVKLSEIELSAFPDSQYAYSLASASNAPEERTYQQDLSSPSSHHMTRHTSHQHPHGEFPAIFNQNSAQAIAGVGGAGDFPGQNLPPVQFRQPDYSSNPMVMLHDAAYPELASPVDSMNMSPSNLRLSIPSISLNDQAYDHRDEMEFAGPLSKRARVQSPVSPSNSRTSAVSGSTSYSGSAISPNRPEGQFPCPRCEKVKKRECELTKHMKRHTRPYGCTFANCSKKFGSRNDWKRHENSQHYLAEMWRCSLKLANGSKCGHLSHEEQHFAKHLESEHDIKDQSEESKTQCRNMHLGREGHHHFWCGFCDQLIEQGGGIQPGAWDIRFKHIGDHFDKDNFKIDDWIDIEKNKKKKLIETEEKNRNANLKSRIDDDSDLGEDGIPFDHPPPYRAQIGRSRRIANEDADADGESDDGAY